MALLAVVASAGRKGVSRDRVLALLWPGADPEQARHTLSQNLYSLRRETGQDWIVATPELRLDPVHQGVELALAADPVPRVRFQAAFSLGESAKPDAVAAVGHLVHPGDCRGGWYSR